MGETTRTRIFLAADPLAGARTVRLQHPRTGVKVMFMRTAERLLEVQSFSEESSEPRSWLLTGGGQGRVQQDGTLFLSTPVDPLFLILPHLWNARGTGDGESRGYFRPLSDLIGGEDAEAIQEHVCTLPRLVDRLVRWRPPLPSHFHLASSPNIPRLTSLSRPLAAGSVRRE